MEDDEGKFHAKCVLWHKFIYGRTYLDDAWLDYAILIDYYKQVASMYVH